MYSSLMKFIFTNNLYDHNPKLDDWARNILKHDLEIQPEKRGRESSTEYYVVVDGIYVWVANDWTGFSVHTMDIEFGHKYGLASGYQMARFNFQDDARVGRPRIDLALRLWWKIKQFRKEWEDI